MKTKKVIIAISVLIVLFGVKYLADRINPPPIAENSPETGIVMPLGLLPNPQLTPGAINLQINQRNINLLCSLIQEIINDNVTAFGFDFDDHDDLFFDDEPTIWSTIYSGHPSRVRDL